MVKETKLYDTLNIKPDASQDQIKKGYHKAALKWHPDKNQSPDAAEKFKEASEAFEILSDPEKRKTYDEFGLDFVLRGGPPPPEPGQNPFADGAVPGGFSGFSGVPGGGGGARTFHFSTNGGTNGFHFSDPESIFAQFMRGGGGSGMGGGMGGGEGFEDIFSGLGGSAGRSRSSRFANGGEHVHRRPPTPEVTVVQRPLPLSLEDLFNGCHKKMKVNHKTFDARTGKRSTQEKILEMDIKPGLKKGSKIKFKSVGDQEEGGQQDLHFVIEEKPHPIFTRDGDDIICTIDLDLKSALTGWKRTVTTIDKRNLPIEKTGPTQPGSQDSYPGLGMPISKKPGQRGNFIVKYNVKFPTHLSPQQKTALKEIL